MALHRGADMLKRKRMDTVDVDKRYADFGGIAGLAEKYESEPLSLVEVGNAVGYSRQTVWNDLARYLGRPPRRYTYSKSKPGRPSFDDLHAFLTHVESQGRRVPPAAADFLARAFQDFSADVLELSGGRGMVVMRKGDRKA